MRNLKRIALVTVVVAGGILIAHSALHAWAQSTVSGARWAESTCANCHHK